MSDTDGIGSNNRRGRQSFVYAPPWKGLIEFRSESKLKARVRILEKELRNADKALQKGVKQQ